MAWYVVRPHDTFLIRDGRTPDEGSAPAGATTTVLPRPSTLGGVVAATAGGRFGYLRGPFLAARDDSGSWSSYFPLPEDVVRRGQASQRVRPLAGSTTVTSAGAGFWPAVPDHQHRDGSAWRHPSGLVAADELARYLRDPEFAPVACSAGIDELLVPERHRGQAQLGWSPADQPRRRAEITHRRPAANVGFLVDTDAVVPAGAAVAFGGAGRRADVEPARAALPVRPNSFPGGRVLVYVATLAIWRSGSRPPLPQGAALVGAASPAPEPVAVSARNSGARRRASTLYWAVPPGSVFFTQFPDEATASAWAQDHHRTALDDGIAGGELASTGFGVVLTGTWRFAL